MARPTVRHVAERAGVSTMTVSRIVRGNYDAVSPEKRELVLEAIRDLDYVPVRTAFQNRHSETKVIGLVVDGTYNYKGLLATKTIDGIREASFMAGYDLLLMRSRPVASLDEQKFQLLDRRCDGYVFISPRERQEVLEKLVQHEIPTVSCYSEDVPDGIGWVIPDNVGVVQNAIEHLTNLGHKKIAYIAGQHEQSAAWHRLDTYIKTMQKLELQPLWTEIPYREHARQAFDFIQQHQATGVICHNDYFALALWDLLNAAGIRVPQDVSLIGIDDIPESAIRGLTTFVNSYEKLGQTAVEALLHLLRGGDVEEAHHTLPMPMVNRVSAASPRTP